MHPQALSIELPSQEAHRAPGEGSKNGWQQAQRFSARQKTEVVLRLLRGEALDVLSRELGIPAARSTTWRAAFRDAGQEALKKQPRDSRDSELSRDELTRALAIFERLQSMRDIARARAALAGGVIRLP